MAMRYGMVYVFIGDMVHYIAKAVYMYNKTKHESLAFK